MKHDQYLHLCCLYHELWDAREYYAALKVLASIYDQLSDLEELKRKEALRVIQPPPPNDLLEIVQAGFQRDLKRMIGILNIGERYDPDEVLLVLTIREEITSLASLLLKVYGIDSERLISFAEVDRTITHKIGRLPLTGKCHSLYYLLFPNRK